MKVVILAGGKGTRISEESYTKPKPMIEIAGKPILWHIMKIYSYYGFNNFIICLGYKGYIVKEYFTNYYLHQSDVTIDLNNNSIDIHKTAAEPWKITLVDTGLDTMTGGRLLRVKDYIGQEAFMMTYGDGLSNIDISELVRVHKKHKKQATLTAIQPSGRFGALNIKADSAIQSFEEKPQNEVGWVNGGFFVLEPEIFDYLQEGDNTIWERAPIQNIAKNNQLTAYKHYGFWKCMDTLRDKVELEKMWNNGETPWKLW